jgi:selenocysteine-specific elongation factor
LIAMPSSKPLSAPTPNQNLKHVIVGTAGHIDHGKSALVQALTGTNPDRLEEEQRRGITIDLGFAFLDLANIRFGFVDVPGHERFVRNMLAGAGGIDLVLLVIAADEGVKPQTREHFDICRLLEIPRGIVVLTKSDLVSADALDSARLDGEEFVRGSFLEGAPIISVSAKTGAGLAELHAALASVSGQVPSRDTKNYFRLPIDRAFAMKGFGTVVTGTLISGGVGVEDEVELHPSARRLRVRGLHSGGRAVKSASAGQRTAVNLAGVDLNDVQRGMVLTASGIFSATKHMDARITLLDSAPPLKSRARVHFHQGTASTVAQVILMEGSQLAPGGSVFAHFVFQDEIYLLSGDRFIMRRFSPVVTIGGGVVLQTLRRKKVRDAEVARLLEIIARGDREEILFAIVNSAPKGLSLRDVVSRTAWPEDEALALAETLVQKKSARILGRAPVFLASGARVDACAARLREAVAKFHKEKPLAEGVSREDLRARASGDAGPEIFHAALAQLVSAKELVVTGDAVKLAGRTVQLNTEDARIRAGIESAYTQSGLSSPSPAEVFVKLGFDKTRAQNVLQLLLREGVLLKVVDGIIFHANAMADLRGKLAQRKLQNNSRLSVPAFKELAGVSRKYAIPLLEYLDRAGVTRRDGDERIVL